MQIHKSCLQLAKLSQFFMKEHTSKQVSILLCLEHDTIRYPFFLAFSTSYQFYSSRELLHLLKCLQFCLTQLSPELTCLSTNHPSPFSLSQPCFFSSYCLHFHLPTQFSAHPVCFPCLPSFMIMDFLHLGRWTTSSLYSV